MEHTGLDKMARWMLVGTAMSDGDDELLDKLVGKRNSNAMKAILDNFEALCTDIDASVSTEEVEAVIREVAESNGLNLRAGKKKKPGRTRKRREKYEFVASIPCRPRRDTNEQNMRIEVSRIIPADPNVKRSIDIRIFSRSDGDPEFRPTRHGVRLYDDIVVDVLESVFEELPEWDLLDLAEKAAGIAMEKEEQNNKGEDG